MHAHDVGKQIPREARVTTPRELLRLEQLLRIFRALQTSHVLHISMNARWHMNRLLNDKNTKKKKVKSLM